MDGWCVLLAAVSALVVAFGWTVLRWRGVDLPAQLYRVEEFRAHGFTLWDSQWYAGHWTLDYSVLYPPMGALVGMEPLALLSAALATAAFDRLVVRQLGPRARVGSAVFALSVIVETSIGQLAFFSGEALGLACLWALAGTRRRWALAGGLALASTLTSPLAGAFVALALAAWWLTGVEGRPWRRSKPQLDVEGLRAGPWEGDGWRLAFLCGLALAPIVVSSVLFPGQGPMPYPVIDWLWEAVVAGALWCVVPPRLRVVRTGITFYLLATIGSVLIPNALGGNIGRLEDAFALPLAVAFCGVTRAAVPRSHRGRVSVVSGGRLRWWFDRSPTFRYRLALGVMALPLFVSQWAPARQALTSNASRSWTAKGYYTPLVSWLRQGADLTVGPLAPARVDGARVEVVPTRDHWEAAYVAPSVPLARGWERQLDLADNPLFYGKAPLTPATYRAWLEADGVRYVALAGAPLDSAGVAEAALIDAGVPGLRLVWRNPNWRVYAVAGGPGIVSGPASLMAMSGERLRLEATGTGPVLVRVRWAAHWQVTAGDARLQPAPGGWLTMVANRTGPVTLKAALAG